MLRKNVQHFNSKSQFINPLHWHWKILYFDNEKLWFMIKCCHVASFAFFFFSWNHRTVNKSTIVLRQFLISFLNYLLLNLICHFRFRNPWKIPRTLSFIHQPWLTLHNLYYRAPPLNGPALSTIHSSATVTCPPP